MIPKVAASHVALLVPSATKAADLLRPLGFKIGETEDWEGEGTREIYVEHGKGNSLLLMEPIAPGAYRRAMDKRGPGLHHLAVDVLDLDAFLESLSTSGWLLHPVSVRTMKKTRTAYLARPGFPALIEVQERDKLADRSMFVEKVLLPLDPGAAKRVQAIGLSGVVENSEGPASLILGGKRVVISELTKKG